MTQSQVFNVAPFFIVRDLASAFRFYRNRLGFEIMFEGPPGDPFFGIVQRGGAMIMLKVVGVDPLPNYSREPAARWDAYIGVAIRTRWPPNSRRARSSFLSRSRTTTTGCGDLKSRTLTATCCSSAVPSIQSPTLEPPASWRGAL